MPHFKTLQRLLENKIELSVWKKKYIYRNAGGKNTNAQKIWKGSRKKIKKLESL